MYLTKANLNKPLERATKERRWEREAVVREGNGKGTAPFGNDSDEDNDEEDHDDEGSDDDDDGYEKMM